MQPDVHKCSYAESPFGEGDAGDCILRSSDNLYFKAHKMLLLLSSSVFNDMFQLSQPDKSSDSNIPIIPIAEAAPTVRALLLLLSPTESPADASPETIINLYTACQKYIIPTRKLPTIKFDAIYNIVQVEKDPVAAFSLAWRLGLKDQAVAASRHTHAVDLLSTSVVLRILKYSGDVKCLLALQDLRRRRDAGVGQFIVRLRLSEQICDGHKKGGGHLTITKKDEYVEEMDAIRECVKKALDVPFPKFKQPLDFIGLQVGRPASKSTARWAGYEGTHTSRCQCFANFNTAQTFSTMMQMTDAFPQAIEPRTVPSFSEP